MEVIMYVVHPLSLEDTQTRIHKAYSHTIFRGFYFSVSWEQRKGLKEMLVIPSSPCPAWGQMKSWSDSLNTKFSSSFHPLPLSPFSFLRFARSIQLSTRWSLPKGGSQSSITLLFPTAVPARCLELSGGLQDLNMAFQQLNMAFVMDGPGPERVCRTNKSCCWWPCFPTAELWATNTQVQLMWQIWKAE